MLHWWLFLRTISPIAVLIAFYFLWSDVYGKESNDEYVAFGTMLLAWRRDQWRGVVSLIRRHLWSWTVKSFFLPLMTVYHANELQLVYNILAANGAGSMPRYQLFYHLSYAIDLLFCVIGYSVALRLFDSRIRSVEPTADGSRGLGHRHRGVVGDIRAVDERARSAAILDAAVPVSALPRAGTYLSCAT